MLSSSPVRAGWILKEGGAPRSESIIEMIASGNHTIIYGFACGSKRLSASLSRLLLVLFLPEQEKYIRPLYKKVCFFAAPPYKEVCEHSATSIGVIIGLPNRLTNRWHLTKNA